MSGADLVLVDGSSYLYRAFHALPSLSNSQGEPTGVDPLINAVRAMGLPLLRVEGVEADDVIGTLCRQAAEDGLSVLVSTGDKDMAQLVNGSITLVNTMTDSLLDRDGVKRKFDVYPEQIIDYLALVGDSSDNIPGVPKVGPKTAAKWLNQYGSADAIIEHADEIAGKVGESLRENIEQLRLSRELATIRLDIDLPVTLDDLQPGQADVEGLRELYGRFELRTLLRQLDEQAGEPEVVAEAVHGDYETVLDWQSFDKWLHKIDEAALVAVDTETTSLDYMAAEVVGLSLAVTPGEAAYIPVAHDYPGAPDQLDRDEVLEKLRRFLEDPNAAKVGHHLKYDAHVLARHGIRLSGMRFDSMLESYVLNSVATRHDMDSVARYYLGRETIHYEDVAGKGAKQLTFNQVDLETANSPWCPSCCRWRKLAS
jgi:DNA polymerase-1